MAKSASVAPAGMGTKSALDSVKPLLNFTTPKTVTFNDWRLGLLHKLLYLGVIAYTLLLIFKEQRYLLHHTPLNVVTMFSSTETGSATIYHAEQFDEAQKAVYDGVAESPGGSYGYCNNAANDFIYSEEFKYQNITCYFGSAREVSTKSPPAGIFFTTFQATTSTTTFMTSNALECGAAGFASRGLACDPLESNIAMRGARCECVSTSNVFFVGAENVILNIEHRYDSVPQSGALPKTRMRLQGSTQDLLVIPEGSKVEIPLVHLLRLGGIDLDQAYDGDWSLRGAANSPNAFPKQRLTGVALTLKASYYNFFQAPGVDKKGIGSEEDVECVMEIQPSITWTSMGDDIDYGGNALLDTNSNGQHVNRYRYGVYVNVEAHGIISEFNYTTLILAIVQGLVLLKFADVCCSVAAYQIMGNKSKLFKAFGNENVSYKREYARYAAQILITGKLFDLLDVNNNNTIEKAEIYSMLRESPCTAEMSRTNLKMLAAMILEQVDLSREKEAAAAKAKGGKLTAISKMLAKIGIGSADADDEDDRRDNAQRTDAVSSEHITPFELLDLLYPDQCDEDGLMRCIEDLPQEQKENLIQRTKSFRRARSSISA